MGTPKVEDTKCKKLFVVYSGTPTYIQFAVYMDKGSNPYKQCSYAQIEIV